MQCDPKALDKLVCVYYVLVSGVDDHTRARMTRGRRRVRSVEDQPMSGAQGEDGWVNCRARVTQDVEIPGQWAKSTDRQS